jgi:hypothetical protein
VLWVRTTVPPTDTTPIIPVADALLEFREHDPSSEPDRWTGRITAAEAFVEWTTLRRLRRQTVIVDGMTRVGPSGLVAVPVGPVVTVVAAECDGTVLVPGDIEIVDESGILRIGSATGVPVGAGVGTTVYPDITDSHLDYFTHDLLATRSGWYGGEGAGAGGVELTLELEVGYATGAVPEPIRQAMFQLIGLWSAQREGASSAGGILGGGAWTPVPYGVDVLLRPFAITVGGP